MGNTKRRKGNKIVAVTEAPDFHFTSHIESVSPHKISLVKQTTDYRFVDKTSGLMIGDKAYCCDSLDQRLQDRKSIEMIAAYKKNRKKSKFEMALSSSNIFAVKKSNAS